MEPHEPEDQGRDHPKGAGDGNDHDPIREGDHGLPSGPQDRAVVAPQNAVADRPVVVAPDWGGQFVAGPGKVAQADATGLG